MDIEKLRNLCLALPHVTEEVKWGKDLCFCIGGKIFSVTGLEGGHDRTSFKAGPEKFYELTARNGIEPAPYLARYKWVLAQFPALTDDEWQHYLTQSYEFVLAGLPAKVKRGWLKP
jgi:predicted DNA-binding protein (MmcQ/YjbR family)